MNISLYLFFFCAEYKIADKGHSFSVGSCILKNCSEIIYLLGGIRRSTNCWEQLNAEDSWCQMLVYYRDTYQRIVVSRCICTS